MRERSQSFVGGAAVLAGAVAVTKVLGALYKIPLGNLLDGQGMTHFYAAYNIYNLLLILSTAGLPLAASRLVAQAQAQHRPMQARRVFSTAAALLLAVGLALSAVMFCFPQALAAALQDASAAAAIRALSPAVACVCLSSAIRGYTQGLGDMRPTAWSQVLESLGKLLLGLTLCVLLLQKGAPSSLAAAGAIGGVSAGAAMGMLFLLFSLRRQHAEKGSDIPESRRRILRRLLRVGVPITLGAGGMSLMTLLDQSLTLGTLQRALSLSADAAAALYGQYTFGMTLFVLPSSFIYPVTVSLLPAVSRARARHDDAGALRCARSALHLTALLALPMGAGLSVLAGPILRLLYPAVPDTAAAAAYHLTLLGIASVFVCLMVVSGGILQAYGKEKIPLLTLLCGGGVKVLLNYLMVADPAVGIRGAPAGTLYAYALIAVLNLWAVYRCLGGGVEYIRLFWKPVLCAGVMALFARCSYGWLSAVISANAAVAAAVALSAAVYGVLVLALGAVTREELARLPNGAKWAEKLHIR